MQMLNHPGHHGNNSVLRLLLTRILEKSVLSPEQVSLENMAMLKLFYKDI